MLYAATALNKNKKIKNKKQYYIKYSNRIQQKQY